MFCNNCGFKLPDGAAFCPECGFKRPAAPAPEVVRPPEILRTSETVRPNEPPPKITPAPVDAAGKRVFPSVVFSLLLFALVILLIVSLFLLPVADELTSPWSGGKLLQTADDIAGSHFTPGCLAALVLLLLFNLFYANRACLRRAFLALGIILLAAGAATVVLGYFNPELQRLLPGFPEAFADTSMILGLGAEALGFLFLCVYLIIRSARRGAPSRSVRRGGLAVLVINLLLGVVAAACAVLSVTGLL